MRIQFGGQDWLTPAAQLMTAHEPMLESVHWTRSDVGVRLVNCEELVIDELGNWVDDTRVAGRLFDIFTGKEIDK